MFIFLELVKSPVLLPNCFSDVITFDQFDHRTLSFFFLSTPNDFEATLRGEKRANLRDKWPLFDFLLCRHCVSM